MKLTNYLSRKKLGRSKEREETPVHMSTNLPSHCMESSWLNIMHAIRKDPENQNDQPEDFSVVSD